MRIPPLNADFFRVGTYPELLGVGCVSFDVILWCVRGKSFARGAYIFSGKRRSTIIFETVRLTEYAIFKAFHVFERIYFMSSDVVS